MRCGGGVGVKTRLPIRLRQDLEGGRGLNSREEGLKSRGLEN